MSNRFKFLDTLFPCGDERLFGEVVGISIVASRSFVFETHKTFAKRKQWYRNASVNAWHLHRALCRELKAFDAYAGIPHKSLTAVVGDIVEISYLRNFIWDIQYSNWALRATNRRKTSELERFCMLLLSSDGVSQKEDEQLVNKEQIFWLRASAQAKKLRR